ncbi:MAG: GNAT family N-acetyltransferase [Anaerolineales bacterium]|nr:GNAT family N-acetyltransferase [Anaerolineales bacterium]
MLDSVTVRPILPDELEKVAYVRAASLGGDQAACLTDLQNNPRYNSSNIIVAEYQGEVIGTITLFPAQMWLSGVPISVGAVTGVAVLPQFQRKGIAGKMMDFSIVRMVAEGRAMSVLFPHSHKYYRQFGFGTLGDLHAYRINPHNLTVFAEGHRVRAFTPDDLPMMRVMYKGQLTWHNGWFTRSNEWWDKIVAHMPNIMVFDNDGTIEGYYTYDLETGKTGEIVLRLKEFFAAEDQAYRGLIGYLAAQNEADVIEYLAPPDTPLRHSLRQPKADDAQNRGYIFNDLCHVTPGPVARIINLSTALTKRFYARHMSGERVIRVSDPLIPTNEEPLLFRLVDGRAETRSADGRKTQIETDIATMTQILCGYLTAQDARRLGRLQSNEDTCSWLDKAIEDSPVYIQPGDWF